MIAHTDDHLDLCAGHALRNLHDAERRRWGELAALGCPECEIAVGRFAEAALVVARSAPLQPPPGSLRTKVLSDALIATATVAERSHAQSRPPTVRIGGGIGIRSWIAAYLAAAIVALVIYYNFQIKRMMAENAVLAQRVAQVSAQMVEVARWELTIAGPGARALSLRPLHPGGAAGRVTVFFDPHSRRALIAGAELAALPGVRYVAWAVGDGAPVALGVMTPDRTGTAILRADPPPNGVAIRSFAVSREPLATTLPPAPRDVLFEGRVSD